VQVFSKAPDDILSIIGRDENDEFGRPFGARCAPRRLAQPVVDVDQDLVSLKENFQILQVLVFGYPGAAVRHEIAPFAVRHPECGDHELLRHDVPVSGWGDSRLGPNLELFLVRAGIVPP